MTTSAPFDRIAEVYDSLWSHTPVGIAQRESVARWCDPLFSSGQRILDLGCGTGEDALRLTRRGIDVLATDQSTLMVRQARQKGVRALQLAIEDLSLLDASFQGALSNFGALNCVADLPQVAASLARLLEPAAPLAMVLMNRCCLHETIHFLARGQVAKAFRRWGSPTASLGCKLFYPGSNAVKRAFAPYFDFCFDAGIGIAVPPSYLSPPALPLRKRLDQALARVPVIRALGDHRLYVFRRHA